MATPPPPVTLRDVAEAAGVHASTVSRALNPATRDVVNQDTVSRVVAAAQRLGYSPHPLARGLRTNTTMTVGIVIPDVENPLFGPIIAGAESELGDLGYSLLIANTKPEDEGESAAIETLLSRRVDGLLLATAKLGDPVVAGLADRGIHAIMMNRHDGAGTFPAVVGDDHAGITLALDHLTSLGHTVIGHVAGPLGLSTGASRCDAFANFHKSGNRTSLVEEADWFGVEPGVAAASRLMESHPELTAIVAANDLLALGCYRAARSLGKTVGTDLSVTGYNDMPLADLMQPALSSIHVNYRQMGADSARMLTDWLATGVAPANDPVMLQPSLVVRSSTGSIHR